MAALNIATKKILQRFFFQDNSIAQNIGVIVGTVGKIYTPIFPFFGNIEISELRPVSTERSGHFTFYRGYSRIFKLSYF